MESEQIIVLNKILDLDKVCRTCLSTDLKLCPIYSNQNEDVRVLEMLTEHCQIKVSPSDSLPKNICKSCLDETKRIQSFIELCKQSDNSLRECLSYETIESSQEVKLELESDDEDAHKEPFYDDEVLVKSENEPNCENDYKKILLLRSRKPLTSNSKMKQKTKVIKTKKLVLTKDKKIECELCSKTFDKVLTYRRHRKTHESIDTGPFKCNKCDKEFSMRKNLRQHLRRHGEKKYLCNYCGNGFPILANLIQHERVHTGEKPFSCTHCSKTFSRRSNLRQHIRTHTGTKPYSCDVCQRCFTQLPHLIVHRRTHTGDRPYKCSICEKGFITPAQLRLHMPKHTGVKPHKCELCQNRFSNTNILNRHMKMKHLKDENGKSLLTVAKHTEKSKPKETQTFLCTTCGKQLANQTTLMIHQRIHTDDRPFGCEICGKRFRHAPTLKVHILTHTGERPYQCTQCDKKFAQRNHLIYHERTHSGEKPYECSYCGKKFALNGNLTVHLRMHTGETPYLCNICGRGYFDSSSLKKHVRAQHPDTKE